MNQADYAVKIRISPQFIAVISNLDQRQTGKISFCFLRCRWGFAEASSNALICSILYLMEASPFDNSLTMSRCDDLNSVGIDATTALKNFFTNLMNWPTEVWGFLAK